MEGTETSKKIQTAGLEAFQAVVEGIQENYTQTKDLAQYSIARQEEAEGGYASTYRLLKNGEPVGDAIHIPKDQFLRSVDIKVSASDGFPAEGFKKGEKYIEMVVDTAENGGTGKALYLKMGDIVSPVKQGDGIVVSDENAVSIKVDAASANGITAGPGGLALSLATAQSAGAMSAADKEKLDGLSFQEITKEEVKALFVPAPGGGTQE